MDAREYNRRFEDRTIRYGGGLLPPTPVVHVSVSPEYAETFDGQVATLVAAGLFSRMTANLAMDVPDVALMPTLGSGAALADLAHSTMVAARPAGSYALRSARESDFRMVLGRSGDGFVAHGTGWNAYIGRAPSPLGEPVGENAIGAAFSVIHAAAELQKNGLVPSTAARVLDTLHWQVGEPTAVLRDVTTPQRELGSIWVVGVGSVGTAALFFLSLMARRFSVVLVDRDKVKVENVARSPLFTAKDALNEVPKVIAVQERLREAGVSDVEAVENWMDGIDGRWLSRSAGTPDIVIAAANERGARSLIENGFPPLQVYATTGRSWQTTLMRHIPLVDACSRCLPNTEVQSAPPVCASDSMVESRDAPERFDSSLPFLSYAAGLMTAAEIIKATLPAYPFTSNRVFYESRSVHQLREVPLQRRVDCSCRLRSADVHGNAIAGSRFAHLSGVEPPTSRQ